MTVCEKCWRDSEYASAFVESDAYLQLMLARDAAGETCTPHEQAGPDATECPRCHRMTVHQYARICMTCGLSGSQGDGQKEKGK
jgi:hypothetical protein